MDPIRSIYLTSVYLALLTGFREHDEETSKYELSLLQMGQNFSIDGFSEDFSHSVSGNRMKGYHDLTASNLVEGITDPRLDGVQLDLPQSTPTQDQLNVTSEEAMEFGTRSMVPDEEPPSVNIIPIDDTKSRLPDNGGKSETPRISLHLKSCHVRSQYWSLGSKIHPSVGPQDGKGSVELQEDDIRRVDDQSAWPLTYPVAIMYLAFVTFVTTAIIA